MPPVHLFGGLDSGHQCFPPRPNIQGAVTVFAEGRPIHCVGHMWVPHTCAPPVPPHPSVLAIGSFTVFAEGAGVGRLGDLLSCGSMTVDGAATVFSN